MPIAEKARRARGISKHLRHVRWQNIVPRLSDCTSSSAQKGSKNRADELHDEALLKILLRVMIAQFLCYPCHLMRTKQNLTHVVVKLSAWVVNLQWYWTMEDIKKGNKKEELGMCAFCRTLTPSSEEEEIERIKKLMEKGNDKAYYELAGYYAQGIKGMPQDWVKANELWLKAGELGYAEGYYNLGVNYDIGNGTEI